MQLVDVGYSNKEFKFNKNSVGRQEKKNKIKILDPLRLPINIILFKTQ